jgi:hypothetical protein
MRAADDTATDRDPAAGSGRSDLLHPPGSGSGGVVAAPPEVLLRLLFILHRGFVEARNLGYAGRSEQIAELADAMEVLPGELLKWDERSMELVRFALKNYEDKFPGCRYDYSPYLDRWPVPDRY